MIIDDHQLSFLTRFQAHNFRSLIANKRFLHPGFFSYINNFTSNGLRSMSGAAPRLTDVADLFNMNHWQGDYYNILSIVV